MENQSSASKRTFESTHTWIAFRADLSKLSYEVWMLLGAIQSKCEHVANALLPPETAAKLHELYLAKGVHATTAIEGNTFNEE